MSILTRSTVRLAVAAALALGLAGCQTQSTTEGYGPVETWPSYQASRQNRGGD